jgi:Fe-S oxidoreductase
MHKFAYLPENVGLYGCVGCGRCIQSCPVQLDIRQVLQRVQREAEGPEDTHEPATGAPPRTTTRAPVGGRG